MSSEENQFNVQGYNIVTILKRLEAATSRLEDITVFQDEANKQRALQQPNLDNLQENIQSTNTNSQTSSGTGNGTGSATATENQAASTSAGVTSTGSGSTQPQEDSKPKSIVAFEEYIKANVVPLIEESSQIDPIVAESANLFGQAFKDQLSFLQIASQSQKPDYSDPAFVKVMAPLNDKITKINDLKDANRKSEFFNHLNSISESGAIFFWIGVPTPVSYISDTKDSAKFWLDRVLRDFKGKDPIHVQWVNQVSKIFDELKAYVKEYHTTGPSWNPNGTSFAAAVEKHFSSGESAPSSSNTTAPAPVPTPAGSGTSSVPAPPPPPPPPASIFEDSSAGSAANSGSAATGGGMNAVFAQLNQGTSVTSGLKKVEKSEMTHKNPELRKQPPVAPKKPKNLSRSTSSAAASASADAGTGVGAGAGAGAAVKRPPKKELVDGTKWIIQNYTKDDLKAEGLQTIAIETEMHQSVFIGNCSDVTIQIKGKANAVSISETKSIGVVIDSLVSGVELIKSYKYGLQVTGLVPMISIDKSDEGSIYLSQESIDHDVQIFTSSSTALNINVPEANDDYKELAVPEQFVSTIKDGKLVSSINEHAG
ncbi:conserved hypothetical protein [Lodderomyces elongisporus NRRL YB-4239]|uniref:Adenylyl cyclase-associated protein n=1 Tax=Lodderomyces elongisporus (strain ATCC 11503 / CBS 2605 / JCM 1781 / NBRC 1676 / NRRL YB-4239) TaxID=379508 RepID=A5E156_LODEL|nr:conserved hypothetical protein [Lodderomyces elongisporus NRRL YB-4239]